MPRLRASHRASACDPLMFPGDDCSLDYYSRAMSSKICVLRVTLLLHFSKLLAHETREHFPIRHGQETCDRRNSLRVGADEYARLPALDSAHDRLARDFGWQPQKLPVFLEPSRDLLFAHAGGNACLLCDGRGDAARMDHGYADVRTFELVSQRL